MMPILLGRGSAGISHNIAQACQASLFTFLSVLRGRCPIGAEEEGCSQSACRFQIIVLQKSPLWLPPPRPSSVRPELSHVGISVVSTEARRAERRDLLSKIGRLSWREGLSAPRFALRSRRRKNTTCDSPGVRPGAASISAGARRRAFQRAGLD